MPLAPSTPRRRHALCSLLCLALVLVLASVAAAGAEPDSSALFERQPVALPWDSLPRHLQRRKPGAWTDEDVAAHHAFVKRVAEEVDAQPRQPLIPAVEALKRLIETKPRFYMHFVQMFQQIPWRYPYWQDAGAGAPQIRDYDHMLRVLSHLASTAPSLESSGIPITNVMTYAMGTASGHAAFLDPEVNEAMRKILRAWSAYLESPASRSVMARREGSWLGPTTLQALEQIGNAPYNTSLRFDQIYQCDASAEYFGFRSWDDLFTRRLRPEARPVASPDDDDVIVSACEATPYNLAHGVRLRDAFWAKGQPYSVLDMLGHDRLAHHFAGGSVYQAFLTPLTYHRWHAPVAGTVRRAVNVPGSYYSTPLSAGVGDANVTDIDPNGVINAQAYLTAVSARAVVFIEADNPAIGLMAFVAVGMTEVSSCQITVREGQRVRKGQELGTFHYGGSSHCLLFRPGVEFEDMPDPRNVSLTHVDNVPVRGKLARVKRPRTKEGGKS
ncbi:hypothetical protein CDD83_1119 [Cordyceps sp. RAO-2017]|nr:hypothetical protein CDD83_1119 [Cordyceps sp. RAO-2017]